MAALLALEGVSKSFGALRVTDNVTLALEQSEALGILGPNGAGKTTLFNLISGDLKPDTGRVLLAGEDITALPPHRRCRAGIGRSYQIPHPFSGMTVFENLLVAAVFGGGMSESGAAGLCADILARTGLSRRANQLAGTLTLLDRIRGTDDLEEVVVADGELHVEVEQAVELLARGHPIEVTFEDRPRHPGSHRHRPARPG